VPDDPALEPHRKHLEEPPEDFLAARLKLLGISPAAFAKAPAIIISDREKPALIHPKRFEPAGLGTIKRHVARVKPASLEHLKEVAGVPGRAFARRPESGRRRLRGATLRKVDDARIARLAPGTKFANLELADQEAVWNAAHNLLYGPATADIVERPGYDYVIATMLDLSSRLSVFFGQDLIVQDHTAVRLTGFGTAYFNNVIVYGDGGISPGDTTKLHAYAIKHL
jgi:hypothetical protein